MAMSSSDNDVTQALLHANQKGTVHDVLADHDQQLAAAGNQIWQGRVDARKDVILQKILLATGADKVDGDGNGGLGDDAHRTIDRGRLVQIAYTDWLYRQNGVTPASKSPAYDANLQMIHAYLSGDEQRQVEALEGVFDKYHKELSNSDNNNKNIAPYVGLAGIVCDIMQTNEDDLRQMAYNAAQPSPFVNYGLRDGTYPDGATQLIATTNGVGPEQVADAINHGQPVWQQVAIALAQDNERFTTGTLKAREDKWAYDGGQHWQARVDGFKDAMLRDILTAAGTDKIDYIKSSESEVVDTFTRKVGRTQLIGMAFADFTYIRNQHAPDFDKKSFEENRAAIALLSPEEQNQIKALEAVYRKYNDHTTNAKNNPNNDPSIAPYVSVAGIVNDIVKAGDAKVNTASYYLRDKQAPGDFQPENFLNYQVRDGSDQTQYISAVDGSLPEQIAARLAAAKPKLVPAASKAPKPPVPQAQQIATSAPPRPVNHRRDHGSTPDRLARVDTDRRTRRQGRLNKRYASGSGAGTLRADTARNFTNQGGGTLTDSTNNPGSVGGDGAVLTNAVFTTGDQQPRPILDANVVSSTAPCDNTLAVDPTTNPEAKLAAYADFKNDVAAKEAKKHGRTLSSNDLNMIELKLVRNNEYVPGGQDKIAALQAARTASPPSAGSPITTASSAGAKPLQQKPPIKFSGPGYNV